MYSLRLQHVLDLQQLCRNDALYDALYACAKETDKVARVTLNPSDPFIAAGRCPRFSALPVQDAAPDLLDALSEKVVDTAFFTSTRPQEELEAAVQELPQMPASKMSGRLILRSRGLPCLPPICSPGFSKTPSPPDERYLEGAD